MTMLSFALTIGNLSDGQWLQGAFFASMTFLSFLVFVVKSLKEDGWI
jgi:hypothetical protein